MNVTVDYSLQQTIKRDPFPRYLLEPILVQTMAEPGFRYGVVAADEKRRKIVYRALLDLLEKLVDTVEQIVEKVVADAIYFKNGSYIRVYSPASYEYKGRGYRFDRTFFDEGTMQLYEKYYISSERYQPHVYETPFDACVVTTAPPEWSQPAINCEPHIDEKAWEEMILNGITKERMNHYI